MSFQDRNPDARGSGSTWNSPGCTPRFNLNKALILALTSCRKLCYPHALHLLRNLMHASLGLVLAEIPQIPKHLSPRDGNYPQVLHKARYSSI